MGADSVLRFVEAVGHFSIPQSDSEYVYEAFKSGNVKISREQFARALSGQAPKDEEPKEDTAQDPPKAKASPSKSLDPAYQPLRQPKRGSY